MPIKNNQILCCPWRKEPHQIKNCQYHCWNCGDSLGTVKLAQVEVQQDIFFLCRGCIKKITQNDKR